MRKGKGRDRRTRRGCRPLVELYARLATGRGYDTSEAGQRALGRFVLAVADRKADTADHRCGDGLLLLAFLAASAGLHPLVETLIRGPLDRPAEPADDTGLLTSCETNLVRAFWDYVAAIRSDPPSPRREYIGPRGRVRVVPFLEQQEFARMDSLFKNGYRFLDDVRARADKPPIFESLPAFVPAAGIPLSRGSQRGAERTRGERPDADQAADQKTGLGAALVGVRWLIVVALLGALVLIAWQMFDRGETRSPDALAAKVRDMRRLIRQRRARLPTPPRSSHDSADADEDGATGPERARATAHRVIPITLDEGPRQVLGWDDGHWQIADRAGTIEFSAPPHLRLPAPVYGAAAGDLDGDGRAELAVYSSNAYEGQMAERSGVWLFRRVGAGWAPFDWLPAHRGEPDDAGCERTLALHHHSGLTVITPALREARRLCQSEIARVGIRDREVHITLRHYGREYLTSRCWDWGCEPPRAVFTPDADILSSLYVRAADTGERLLVLGTGPWAEDSAFAYSAIVVPDSVPDRDSARSTSDRSQARHARARRWPTGGITYLAPIDDTWFAMLTTTRNLDEHPDGWRGTAALRVVAATAAGDAIERAGDTSHGFDCPHVAGLAVAKDSGGEARYVLTLCQRVALVENGKKLELDLEAPWILRAHDLRFGLAAQPPSSIEIGRLAAPALQTDDIAGDGADEVLISSFGKHGFTLAYRVTANGVEPIEW